MKVGIIGGGRVGSRLAASLREAGVLAGITAASEQHSAQLAQQFGVPATDNAKLWQAADVLLLSEENPPLNFTRAGQPSGFSVELVRLLAAQDP